VKMPTVRPDLVADWTSTASVSFGIPAYNEGDGILPTLRSLWDALGALRLTNSVVILSDSYDQPGRSSAPAATSWARDVGAKLEINTVDRRRSVKEALNVVFEQARSDVLILVNADVLVPTQSLLSMLNALFSAPRPIAAIGTILPDPAFSSLNHRAGAWQMRAVWRASRLSARWIGPNSFRAEGAFCGVWRAFYSTYRFPVGTGSIYDDVEFTRALVNGRCPCRNATEAFVYKVPPGSVADLCSGTLRFRAASPEHRRHANEYVAALVETVRDPLGALLYGVGRIWCRRHRLRDSDDSFSEQWRVLDTTKRRRKG
jgi:Glycosyltransferase like family 2